MRGQTVRTFGLAGLMVVALGLLAVPVAARQDKVDTSLSALLERMGQYIAKYEQDLAAVVAEESYQQNVSGQGGLPPDQRQLKSDFLLARAGDAWVAFRDVFEVDGSAVVDRSDRLIDLFVKPTSNSRDQIMRIVDASSRFNLGWVNRTINVPTMVLQFGRLDQQDRSNFRRGGTIDIADGKAREIRFNERALPRVVQTPDNAAATGAFWIDEATGRVVRTELRLSTGSTTAVIGVSYSLEPKLKLWLPVIMTERYSTPRQPSITGRAIYENFRRFDVEVATIIK